MISVFWVVICSLYDGFQKTNALIFILFCLRYSVKIFSTFTICGKLLGAAVQDDVHISNSLYRSCLESSTVASIFPSYLKVAGCQPVELGQVRKFSRNTGSLLYRLQHVTESKKIKVEQLHASFSDFLVFPD